MPCACLLISSNDANSSYAQGCWEHYTMTKKSSHGVLLIITETLYRLIRCCMGPSCEMTGPVSPNWPIALCDLSTPLRKFRQHGCVCISQRVRRCNAPIRPHGKLCSSSPNWPITLYDLATPLKPYGNLCSSSPHWPAIAVSDFATPLSLYRNACKFFWFLSFFAWRYKVNGLGLWVIYCVRAIQPR